MTPDNRRLALRILVAFAVAAVVLGWLAWRYA